VGPHSEEIGGNRKITAIEYRSIFARYKRHCLAEARQRPKPLWWWLVLNILPPAFGRRKTAEVNPKQLYGKWQLLRGSARRQCKMRVGL